MPAQIAVSKTTFKANSQEEFWVSCHGLNPAEFLIAGGAVTVTSRVGNNADTWTEVTWKAQDATKLTLAGKVPDILAGTKPTGDLTITITMPAKGGVKNFCTLSIVIGDIIYTL